jgi:hypothetical protein
VINNYNMGFEFRGVSSKFKLVECIFECCVGAIG